MPFSAEAGSRSRAAPRAWIAVAAVLLLGSIAAVTVDSSLLDWQPALAGREPWRAWTAAWVHYSALHLLANVAGGLLVVAFGLAARVPRRSAIAWLVAWPLTQLGLVLRPDLAHYGGLSGVLHAGVAVVAVHLLVEGRGKRRWVGAAVLVAVAIKIGTESPWGPALRAPTGWDIQVAPFAHLTGFVAGLVAGLMAAAFLARSARSRARLRGLPSARNLERNG